MQPGDFVSYYAKARDVGRGKRPTEARSDIFFLEVRPFNEEFQAAQSSAMMGAGEARSTTWPRGRRSSSSRRGNSSVDRAPGRSAEDIRALARAQGELKTKAEQLAARLMPRAPSVGPDRARRRSRSRGRGGGRSTAAARRRGDGTQSAVAGGLAARRTRSRTRWRPSTSCCGRRPRSAATGGAAAVGGGRRGTKRQPGPVVALRPRAAAPAADQLREPGYDGGGAAAGAAGIGRARQAARAGAAGRTSWAPPGRSWRVGATQMAAEEAKRQLERLTREQEELRRQLERLTAELGQQQRAGGSSQSQSAQGAPQQGGQNAQPGVVVWRRVGIAAAGGGGHAAIGERPEWRPAA